MMHKLFFSFKERMREKSLSQSGKMRLGGQNEIDPKIARIEVLLGGWGWQH